jgi:hypothetical protein
LNKLFAIYSSPLNEKGTRKSKIKFGLDKMPLKSTFMDIYIGLIDLFYHSNLKVMRNNPINAIKIY